MCWVKASYPQCVVVALRCVACRKPYVMRMKVLLIRPFWHIHKSFRPVRIIEPLGLEYIASYIRTEHEVHILDCLAEYWKNYQPISGEPVMFHFGASEKEVRRRIKQYSPDIVGISSLFWTQTDCAFSIADIVKEVDDDIVTVIGGPPASACPEDVLRENENLDIAVVGEGEITFKELLDTNLENVENVRGIVYRRNNSLQRNEPRELIKNLDGIPFPARDLVPYNNYSKRFRNLSTLLIFAYVDSLIKKMRKGKGLVKDRKVFFSSNKLVQKFRRLAPGFLYLELPIGDQLYYELWNKFMENKLPAGSIITSRGCPYDCYFCAIHCVWGRRWRFRSVENVLQELTHLSEKYGVKDVSIQDDNFTVSKRRTIELCKGILERGLDLTLHAPSGVYLPSLDEEVLAWMKRAGFYELYFGIESGDQRILDTVINKKLKLSKVKDVINACRKVGIRSGGYFIVGLPGETKESMRSTLQFAMTSGLDMTRLYICQPFPGSRLYDDCKKKGFLAEGYNPKKALIFGHKSFISTKEFSSKDVEEIAEESRIRLRQLGILQGHIDA